MDHKCMAGEGELNDRGPIHPAKPDKPVITNETPRQEVFTQKSFD